MNDDDERRKLQRLLVVVLSLVIVGGAADLVLDAPDDWLSAHVVFEVGLIVGALAIIVALWRGWFQAETSLGAARESLARHEVEREAWRAASQAAVDGLRVAMQRQFDAWQLTDAERAVAMHLLQGESHKVIARLTNRSERTVRQHAVAVYNKSGLHGRAELAAFFLDDLLAPRAG
jgi:DNA-binding CsgD family transcriptional regulator